MVKDGGSVETPLDSTMSNEERKPGLRPPWQPGQSGNPSGRSKVDPELKRIRQLSTEQFKEVANLILTGTREDLNQLINDGDTPLLKLWIARVVNQGATRGDYHTLDVFLNRLIGKVPDKVDATIERARAPEDILSRDQFAELIRGARGPKSPPSEELIDLTYARYSQGMLASLGVDSLKKEDRD